MNSTSRTGTRRLAVLVASVCVLTSAAYGDEPTALTNGVPVTGLSGATGSDAYYKIDVPAGADTLSIKTTGGTGDVDLYVRKDSQPSTTSYDYRPYLSGNEEAVDVNKPASGTWYILLHGYATYANVTLTATYTTPLPAVKTLTNAVPVTGIAGTANAELYYTIDVPAGATTLEIAISAPPATGDADLYVRKGSLPTTSAYDYRPYLSGSNETVSVDNPDAATWYIMIKGYTDYSGVTLLATYAGGSGTGTVLQNGVAVTGLSGVVNSEKLYRFDLPAGQKTLEIAMSGGTGDADLYVKLKDPPTTTSYDYRPFLTGNNETVDINAPAAGTWFVMVQGYSDYAGVTLQASWGGATALQNNVPVTNLAGALNSETFFSISVPSGQDTLSFNMSGGTGDADMYIKKGSQPTTSSYDYRPVDTQGNSTESITITGDSLQGTWYVLLEGVKDYAGVTLVAAYSVTQTVTTLTSGVSVTNLSAGTGVQKFFSIVVPAGQSKLDIVMSGGTGDADLYVKRGSKPTLSDYDSRPYLTGNNESVSLDNPAADTWYIMLNGYAAYDGVTLTATYTPAPVPITTLTNGVALPGQSGASGSQTFYNIVVPAGQSKLDIVMSGGTGDADLYVKRGSKPTLSDYDYRPYLTGNNESVSIDNPVADTWYIMLNGYAAYDGVTLTATYTPTAPQITTLTNGVALPGQSGATGSETFYKIDVPAGQDYLTIEISGGSGDCDLYVKKGDKPSATSWDYRPYLVGNNEKVDVSNPAAATWYILLRGYQAYSGVTLKATYGQSHNPPPAGSLQFKSATYSVVENAGSVRIYLSRTGGSFGAASVNYATANGTATAGSKYTATSGILTWPDGDATDKYFDVAIINNSTYEGDQTFTAGLSGASGAGLGVPSVTTVTIIDDETPPAGTLQFKAATYSVLENAGSVRIYVSRTGGSSGAASVNYATANGTAAAGVKYTAKSGTLSWSNGDAADKYFDVVVINNSTYEGDQTFTAGLSGASGAGLGVPSVTTVTIIDDETPPAGTLQFKAATYSVLENAGSVRIYVSRTGGSSGAASVNYATANGTAAAGVKYTAKSGTLSWSNGDAADKYFDVVVINNSTYEGDQTFTAGLSGASGAGLGVPSVTTVTIIDDETPPAGTLQFKAATYSVLENAGSVRIYVSRTGGSSGAASVNYATANGTAAAGVKYTAKSGTLSWSNGDAADKYFDVVVINNSTYEGDQTFTAGLSGASGAGLGVPSVTTVTIIDDETPPAGTLQFKAATYSVLENAGSVRIYVSRTGGSSGAASVNYATANGTAAAGVKYTAKSGTLSWSNGDAADKYFDVVVINNSTYEGDQTFTAGLSGASGAGLGVPSVTTVTIIDDETPPAGTLQFKAATYSVLENAGSVRIYVSRTGGSSGAASVNYATANGTAAAGVKYTAKSGTLSWSNGDAADKFFDVVVINNSTYEGDQTFTAGLSGASGAGLGVPSVTTVTIIDDETPPAGNIFNTDPNCVALWRFESGVLTADSVGTNTLQNQGVSANTADKKERTSSGEWKATEKDYMWIANTTLSTQFPFKSATAPKTISVVFWVKLKSLPAIGLTFDPFSKVNDSTNSNCFTTMIDGYGNLGFFIGTNGGTSYEDAWAKTSIVPGKWYHVAITYRDSDHSYRINVWDDAFGTVLADVTGNLKNNIAVTSADVYLGQRQGLPANRYFDGLLDEMVVFNDVLATADIAKIRAGTYSVSAPPAGNNFATDPNCIALWRFESTGLTTDSVGTNTLQNHGVTTNATDKKEGASSAEFKALDKDYFWIANASLAPKFPFSSATASKTISLAFWTKLQSLPTIGLTYDPFSKVNDAAGLNVFSTMIDGYGNLGFLIGTGNGTQYEDAWTTPVITPGQWYHVVVTYKDSDRSYRLNIWNPDTAQVLVDKTGTTVHNITISNVDVYLGARQGLTPGRFLDGLLDEMAVFNDVLATNDIAKIRAGTYGK